MALLRLIGNRIAARQEVALIALLVLTMAMMILPMPTALADILIACNIGISLLLMMAAIHIGSPVELSTLPSLILITTAFRLSLSITTSRMVLVEGDAGEIIRTFGEFVIAGNVVVGLVVYLIITIVQFVVISKGSERVAEVAARFTLDALPGKQISIDTDLKNGDIDQVEARKRRTLLERESQLFGAMDGAMKFVKGDSIASLVIIVINLVGGMAIGCIQRGMSFPDAVQTYSLLAVGDGLIAQIPALLISLTAGVLVTRTASENGGNLGQDIMAQLIAEPRSLQVCAVVLAALALVPGFPAAVFLTLAIILGSAGWLLSTRAKRERERRFQSSRMAELAAPEAVRLSVVVGEAFRGDADAVDRELDAMRLALGARLGIAIPRLRLAEDAATSPQGWRLDINGIPSAEGAASDIADLAAGLRTAVSRVAGQFIGIQETQRLLTGMEAAYGDLVREAAKSAPLVRLAEVLRRLLNEQVEIANLRLILEAVGEWGPREPNTAVLAEHVRVALRSQICFALGGPGKVLPVILIDAGLDEACRAMIHATPNGTTLVIDPAVNERLLAALAAFTGRAGSSDAQASILASSELRRHLRAALGRQALALPVITHGELAPDIRIEVIGTLTHAQIIQPTPQRSIRDALHVIEGAATPRVTVPSVG
jgi:type III secretion protein V